MLFNQATEEGYQHALRHGEYMHAFMVAKQCNDSDKEHYALHQWTTQKVLSSALTTKYTDRIPPLPSVNNSSNSTTATTATTATNATSNTTNTAISTAHQDTDDMASWIQTVSNLFLSNNTDETKNTPTNAATTTSIESTRVELIQMGDKIWDKNQNGIYLAHTCYLLAGCPLEKTGNPLDRRMILLGGDHRNVTNPTLYMSNENLFLTECLDYIRKMNENEKKEKKEKRNFVTDDDDDASICYGNHDMSSFHLLHAVRLQECQLSELATNYLDYLDTNALNEVGKDRADSLLTEIANSKKNQEEKRMNQSIITTCKIRIRIQIQI